MNYKPHEYQQYATDFIIKNPTAAVFLEMGLGKSVIALTAILELCLERFEISRVLVIAPLRVARDTWPTEIQKWDHLKDLTYSVAVGTANERRAALRQKTFVHIINRENVQWLIEDSGIPWQYDMVVIDELSSFKSHQAKRFKSLLKMRPQIKRFVGLTGTPASNGLMDLWAEFRLLDMGKRLGRYITHFRDAFFTPDRRNGMQVFSYRPKPGAEAEIYRRIGDITISMRSADYLQMPECVMNTVPVCIHCEVHRNPGRSVHGSAHPGGSDRLRQHLCGSDQRRGCVRPYPRKYHGHGWCISGACFRHGRLRT